MEELTGALGGGEASAWRSAPSTAARDSWPEEATLLVRCRTGDEDAFAQLVARYRAPVYSYVSRCGVDPADRDDLFQEVFLRVHTAASRFDSSRPVHPWLFTIVANATRSYLRKRRVRQLVFAASQEPASSERDRPAPTTDGERAMAVSQTLEWLERQIPRLPLRQREVLLLAGVERRPLKEIADVLGLPLNTVKTHLRRARLSLAQRLVRAQARPGNERHP